MVFKLYHRIIFNIHHHLSNDKFGNFGAVKVKNRQILGFKRNFEKSKHQKVGVSNIERELIIDFIFITFASICLFTCRCGFQFHRFYSRLHFERHEA